MAITEFKFSVDDFRNPELAKDAEAISMLLIRLLLLEPGTFQSHPNMGIGLYSRYRYGFEGQTASELESDFKKQIEEYLPRFQGVKVNVSDTGKALKISIEIDSVLYGIYYDKDTSNIKSGYTRLSNL